ncbi:MAG: DUF4124 domain-containing protein [Gammaproteobacteria bacterium]|nr:DUF4124 domain-containing protein [Gammaproteobacteria bacterium]
MRKIPMFKSYIVRLIFLSVLVAHFPANAEFYKWTDEAGNVHYGDRPVTVKNKQSVNIYDSGKTTSRPSSGAGEYTKKSTKPASSAVDKRRAVSNMFKKADQRERNKAASDQAMFQKKMDNAARSNELSNKYAARRRQRDIQAGGERFKLARETQEKLDNTLSPCQRNPASATCNQHQVGYRDGAVNRSVNVTPNSYRPLSKRQKEEQRKIKKEHQEKLNKINREHSKENMKELRKILD